MNAAHEQPAPTPDITLLHWPAIALETLVLDVYDFAPASTQHHLVARLIGKVYDVAPPSERCRLLEQLLQPMGVLSLVAVANGVFAKIGARGGYPGLQVRTEDVEFVQSQDVVRLVDFVQQVSVQAVDNLAQLVAASPVLSASAVAAVLITILLKRARSRQPHHGGDSTAA